MLILVIPVYRNESSIEDLLTAVQNLSCHLVHALQVIFVVDGSPDRSYELLREGLLKQSFPSKLILLSKNFGSFAAIRIGLQAGVGDRYAVMAADLQEPPELILEMDSTLRNTDIDVVVGVRDSRKDPLCSRLASQIFWMLYRRYVVPEMPPGGVDVFGCNRQFRDTLLTLDESHSSLVAQLFWLGFKRKFLPYARRERVHGKSAWTFRKKINYLMDSVFAFTDLPIRLLIRMGGLGALLSLFFGMFAVLAKFLGLISVPGYTMIIFAMTFLGALNLFGLGVVGSYAWRAYENTKQRPLALVMTSLSFNVQEEALNGIKKNEYC